MTTDESSTSCAEDSSDGQVFDVIREESVRRRPSRPRTADDDAEAATPTVAATETTSPVDSSGVDVVVDSNQLQSTDAVVSPSFAGSAVHGLTGRVELSQLSRRRCRWTTLSRAHTLHTVYVEVDAEVSVDSDIRASYDRATVDRLTR